MTTQRHIRALGSLCAFLGTLAIALSLSSQAHALRYGAICSGGFANDPMTGKPWENPYPDGMAACNAFLSGMGSSPSWRFNWATQHGEIHAFEERWPGWENDYIESADIVFYTGHGNASNPNWVTVGYPYNDWLSSNDMCLGETSGGQRGVSVLSLSSCYTLTPNPTTPARTDTTGVEAPAGGINYPSSRKFEFFVGGDVVTRWKKTMECGLRMITGTWHQMSTGGNDVLGRNYASYLNGGRAFADAWSRASFDQSATAAAPTTFTSGTSWNDCVDNLNNLKLSNLNSKPRVTTNATYCWVSGW